MKRLSDGIRDVYLETGEYDRCPSFWHLFTYVKGLEYVLDSGGSVILEKLEEEFKKVVDEFQGQSRDKE